MEEEGIGQQRWAVDTTLASTQQLPLHFPLRSCNKHKTTTNKYSATIIQVQLLFILLLLSI